MAAGAFPKGGQDRKKHLSREKNCVAWRKINRRITVLNLFNSPKKFVKLLCRKFVFDVHEKDPLVSLNRLKNIMINTACSKK